VFARVVAVVDGDLISADVDGIPFTGVDRHDGEIAYAALLFRAGIVDETWPTHGVNHLVEHLAFGSVRELVGAENANVQLTTTSFQARGTEDEVAEAIEAFSVALSSLDVDRIEHERRVLTIEAARRTSGGPLSRRYGLRGPGLAEASELGLRHLGADDVRSHVTRWFTAGNAAVFSTIAPDRLRIALPPGDLQAVPVARPVLVEPCWMPTDSRSVELSGVVTCEAMVARVVLGLLRERVLAVLRHDRGLAYDVSVSADLVGAGSVHVHVVSDAGPASAGLVAQVTIAELRRLLEVGPTIADLDRALTPFRRWAGDPQALLSIAAYAAGGVLHGRPLRCRADVEALCLGVTLADVHAVLSELLETAIVAVPTDADPLVGLTRYVEASPEHVIGKEYVNASGATEALVLNDVEVGLRRSDGSAGQSVRFEDCVAAVYQPRSRLRLYSATGAWLQFDASKYRDGDAFLRTVTASLPVGSFVPMDRTVAAIEAVLKPAGSLWWSADGLCEALAERVGWDEEPILAIELDDVGRGPGVLVVTTARLMVARTRAGGESLEMLLVGEIEGVGVIERFKPRAIELRVGGARCGVTARTPEAAADARSAIELVVSQRKDLSTRSEEVTSDAVRVIGTAEAGIPGLARRHLRFVRIVVPLVLWGSGAALTAASGKNSVLGSFAAVVGLFGALALRLAVPLVARRVTDRRGRRTDLLSAYLIGSICAGAFIVAAIVVAATRHG
jgi:hypothetical protein